MAPPLLTLQDIHLTFGAEPLLRGANLSISEGDRLCLVGRNGSGKSTLLKIVAGIVDPDGGVRFIQPGTTVRYLPQEPDLSKFPTIQAYVESGLTEGDDPYRASYLLSELGLDGSLPTAGLSGGEAKRAALVCAMAPEPDILLLDEPTNHLDLPAIEWLEKNLSTTRSALVMISHDRRFLETLSRKTVWVDRGGTRELDRSYAAFETWRDEILEKEELEAHKLDRKIVREEHWVTYGVSGRRKRNVKRLADLASLRKQRAERTAAAGNVRLEVADAAASGKLVAKVESISKSLGGRALVRNFSTIIARGDRLGIAGPNGTGKTTLVRMLTGELAPDGGAIKHGANIDVLVLDQKRESLDLNWTMREALTDGGGDLVTVGGAKKHVLAYMKDFLFQPEQAGTPLHALSGGERARLTLARGLRLPSNLLVLDEPTNDLDIETLDLLQETISEYDGTVILISHDRDFLDRICTSIVVPDGNGIWIEYAGGYSDMLAQRDAGGRSETPEKAGTKAARKPKEERRSKPAGRMTFKDKHALETLPGEIEKLEAEVSRLNEVLAEPDLFTRDAERFNRAMEKLASVQAELSRKEERWLELEMLREELEA